MDSSDYDDNDDDNNKTGAKDNIYFGASDGANAGDKGGDSTGSGGGSTEWLRFLNLSALSETLGATAKSNTSSSTKSRRIEVGK